MKWCIIVLLQLLFFHAPATGDPAGIYNFKVAAFKSGEIDLSAYKGKKILIVNAPWLANDESQYAELEQLYKKYNGKLVIIAFLSDDFGMPPGSHRELLHYREREYAVSYPLAARIAVRGPEMPPIYQWLTEKKHNNFQSTEVKWNFHKFLVNENGQLVAVFDPKVRAFDPRLIAAIEQ